MQDMVRGVASSYVINLNHSQSYTVTSKGVVRSSGNRYFIVAEL